MASDRAGGIALVAVAVAVALEARTFTVGFLADPLGPKAVPLLTAALIGVGGLWLALRPRHRATWPAREVVGRIGLVVGSFLLYAALIPILGFLVATTLEMSALSRLFGSRWGAGIASALAFTLVLYALFVYALGLPLPIGSLFLVRGG